MSTTLIRNYGDSDRARCVDQTARPSTPPHRYIPFRKSINRGVALVPNRTIRVLYPIITHAALFKLATTDAPVTLLRDLLHSTDNTSKIINLAKHIPRDLFSQTIDVLLDTNDPRLLELIRYKTGLPREHSRVIESLQLTAKIFNTDEDWRVKSYTDKMKERKLALHPAPVKHSLTTAPLKRVLLALIYLCTHITDPTLFSKLKPQDLLAYTYLRIKQIRESRTDPYLHRIDRLNLIF